MFLKNYDDHKNFHKVTSEYAQQKRASNHHNIYLNTFYIKQKSKLCISEKN